MRLLHLPLELWGWDKILKIVFEASKLLFLDDWMESSTRMGFARAWLLIDTKQTIYPGTKVRVMDEVVWQEFIYEDLPNLCYFCGHLIVQSETY